MDNPASVFTGRTLPWQHQAKIIFRLVGVRRQCTEHIRLSMPPATHRCPSARLFFPLRQKALFSGGG
ncbi:hypothetical protein DR106_20055 [Escherichia coli]|nr:hypothetical protein DR106_20055 [Escherichia coli]